MTHDAPTFEKLKTEYEKLQNTITILISKERELTKSKTKLEQKFEELDREARECRSEVECIISYLRSPGGMNPKNLTRECMRQFLEERQKREIQWLEMKHQMERQLFDQTYKPDGAELSSSTSNESK